jgi:DNA primase catalytic core
MPRVDVSKILAQIEIDQVAEKLGMRIREDTNARKMAICPFHNDTTPSLLIDTSRDHDLQHFHCFACGEHGTAIDLVKERLNVDFNGAVDWLSTTFGLSARSPSAQESPVGTRQSGLERGYQIYSSASKVDHFNDWAVSRHFDPNFLRNAGYVYAASGTLTSNQRLVKMSVDSRLELMGDLEDASLVKKLLPTVGSSLHILTGSEIQYTDAFAGDRVVFPINDQRRKLIGLAARAAGPLAALQKAKYLFTKNFPKGRVLYRGDQAFNLVRTLSKRGVSEVNLYVCEGFLDALRLESIGQPAVAVMGSSITKDQVQLLKELSETLGNKQTTLTILLCFDRDEAGLKGASTSALSLLDAGLDVAFVWPSAKTLMGQGIAPDSKDPDTYLVGLSSTEALELLAESVYPPGTAILANRFGVTAEELLDEERWKIASPSRKFRAFEKALAEFRKIRFSNPTRIRHWIGDGSGDATPSVSEWLGYLDARALSSSTIGDTYLTNPAARLNHARMLAYRGSRRGELACDEPMWERLDVAATTFNVLLNERITRQVTSPVGPFDAVWVARTFGGEEPRLKVMPRPEDLIVHQYLLNDLLTERWDSDSIGIAQFSQCIPAVRFYREDRKTITTGLVEKSSTSEGMVREGMTLSFAYQIDMDVLEGRQPASDQGMFRSFHECWHEFMQSLKQQARKIGHVHAIRLDVSRYYDRIRRSVVRDALQGKIQAAFESIPGDATGIARPDISAGSESPASRAGTIVDQLSDLMFGYAYQSPETGQVRTADPGRGIPQGPVISAWVGTITLFSVDQVAAELMARHNSDGAIRIGYARYVDDIVLLAESASLLEELREAIDAKTRTLDLTLVAKADAIPPMTSDEFSTYINEGRMLDGSGPTWSPPIVGDGEAGWEFWSATPSSDRQSALQLLSNLELYKSPAQIILNTVRTAFLAMDLRASELSKGARLLWYATAIDLLSKEPVENATAKLAWGKFKAYWKACTDGAGWQLNPAQNGWEAVTLFALEGLEKLIDHTGSRLRGLSLEEDHARQQRILTLARIATTQEFKDQVFSEKPSLVHQTNRRFELLQWKASKATGQHQIDRQYLAERSRPVQEWHAFDWFHSAIERLSWVQAEDRVDPLNVFETPYARQKGITGSDAISFKLFGYFLPDAQSPQGDAVKTGNDNHLDARLISCALQTLAAVVPKDMIFTLLSARRNLLNFEPTASFMFMPPLPGIEQRRLIACELTQSPADQSAIAALTTFEFSNVLLNAPPLNFLGVQENVCLELAPVWEIASNDGDVLVRRSAAIPDDTRLQVRVRPQSTQPNTSRISLQESAKLYKRIVLAVLEFGKQHPGYELIPAWPYIATDKENGSLFLLSEGAKQDEVGNRAFIRDGGRALRTVEVPIFEAHLWRAGMALSDYLGLSDDINKFKSMSSDVPFDNVTDGALARYVLRNQCRKLRGAFADSQIARRVREDSLLPASIERALELLEHFPEEGDAPSQLKYVLATEVETAAMRTRLQDQKLTLGVSAFLIAVTGGVLSQLPVSIGGPLARDGAGLEDLRRDFAGVLTLARTIWQFATDPNDEQLIAWQALRSGIVGLGIKIGLDGLLTSLRAHPEFASVASFDFPAEWEIPSEKAVEDRESGNQSSPSGALSDNSDDSGLLNLLRQLVKLLGHRMRSGEADNTTLTEKTVSRIKEMATELAKLGSVDSSENSNAAWPFVGVSTSITSVLNITLLETVVSLVRELDVELSLQVLLVREQMYGFNAQTRRFTDSRSRTWELKPAMISQFPMRAKNIEEEYCDGRILRVWTEVIDKKSGRLLSVAVLGDPFASIAIAKSESARTGAEVANPEGVTIPTLSIDLAQDQDVKRSEPLHADEPTKNEEDGAGSSIETLEKESDESSAAINQQNQAASSARQPRPPLPLQSRAHTFRRRQQDEWTKRANAKNPAHVRVAILQSSIDLTYAHPMCETAPKNWPLGESCKRSLLAALAASKPPYYDTLSKAISKPGNGHLWDHANVSMPSWAEHRRRRFLARSIDACEDLDVDLLVLPEYSVRPETVSWLRQYLAGKHVAVLAGTYMQFSNDSPDARCSAPLSLLWPIPKEILSDSLVTQNAPTGAIPTNFTGAAVLQLERRKKYRSVGLNEFIRPGSKPLAPLFVPADLANEISAQHNLTLSTKGIVKLLADSRLPLRHFIELICSEIFLLTSPANYPQIAKDYVWAHRRFGSSSEEEEVFRDVVRLSEYLSIGGTKDRSPRRTIAVVPAATTRTADYWIAGQAALLAAGTTTVFCNATGPGLKGGSCFIGRESWKGIDASAGYISSITPYHGWSKGIYYSSKEDPLSERDQALVVADIDPIHMSEGKPRPQLLPVPLQLVAYLPIAETVDTSTLNKSLCERVNVVCAAANTLFEKEDLPENLHDRSDFWEAVSNCEPGADPKMMKKFSKFFSDPKAIYGRLEAAKNDGSLQPCFGTGITTTSGSPAFYDWLDVDLSLNDGEDLPQISVPPWK